VAILNYTTQISSQKTVTEIQDILAKAGAQAIMTEYDSNGVLSAMSFRLMTPSGSLSFTLPANISNVFEVIKKEKKLPLRERTREQAARVAWRILKDWIEAQMAIVQAQCAELPEVFLPYARTRNGETLYSQIKGNGFLQIAGPKKESE
jgi:hypothetical protein